MAERLTIPEEAMRLACEAYEAAVKDEYDAAELGALKDDQELSQHAEIVAVRAAAPLIVASYLEQLADDLNSRAVARHQIGEDNGSECDEDCDLSGCHASAAADTYLLTRDRLRARAAELRGGEGS